MATARLDTAGIVEGGKNLKQVGTCCYLREFKGSERRERERGEKGKGRRKWQKKNRVRGEEEKKRKNR